MLLERFINWLVEECERVLKTSDSMRHRSSIVDDMQRIIDLSIAKCDPAEMEEFRILGYESKIRFWSRESSDETRKRFPMLALCMISEYESAGISVWESDAVEYKKVYRSPYSKYIKEKVVKLLEFVKENADNPQYQHLFIKYETTTMTVANTLADALELNGSISDKIKEEVMKILESFGNTLADKQCEIRKLEEIDKKAINNSLIERLKREQEFISKYV